MTDVPDMLDALRNPSDLTALDLLQPLTHRNPVQTAKLVEKSLRVHPAF